VFVPAAHAQSAERVPPARPALALVGLDRHPAGPYRFIRNPMISGVAMFLIGQALFWGSRAVAGVFILINHMYFVLSEEPGLDLRFGESYRVYKANVARWIPRLRPSRVTGHKR
jgi:hypothetical protein